MVKPGGVASSGLWELEGRGTRTFTELQNRYLAEAVWKAAPKRVRAPYTKSIGLRLNHPSSAGSGKAGVNLRGPSRKAKYSQATDSELVP